MAARSGTTLLLRAFLFASLLTAALHSTAEQLSFQQPFALMPQAQSDKAVALLHAAGEYLVAWKKPGSQGTVGMASWPDEGKAEPLYISLTDAVTTVQPALVSTGADRYLFWLDPGGNINYKYCAGQCSWDNLPVYTLNVAAGMEGDGLTAAYVSGKIVLANRTQGKDREWMALLTTGADGMLHTSSFREIAAKRSAVLSFIAAGNGAVRFCRSDGGQIIYQEYNVDKDIFGPDQTLATGSGMTAVSCFFDGRRSIGLWRSKRDQQWHYQVTNGSDDGAVATVPGLPDASLPVTICASQAEDVLIAYPGAGGQVYLAYGDAYDPASWMGATLFPDKEQYTLKDIVLPGAHDAGMSILNGVGGKSTYTINECNTLTQKLPVALQLRAGIRMFDLRIDRYQGALYTKHAPSDCMDDAVGGGYGERLDSVLLAVKHFLDTYPSEFVLLSFCHFCDRHISVADQGKAIASLLGTDKVFYPAGRKLDDIPLKALAGKVMISFEGYDFPRSGVVSNTMTDRSDAFFNYKRRYAATNSMDTLLRAQQKFFTGLKGTLDRNDIVRVDWQLTQMGQEAALSCSQFQSEDANLLLDGALLLVNAIKKNKGIISLALMGNRYLAQQLQQWTNDGVIDKDNKPNILYVDVAGSWITDICVGLNRSALYSR